MTNIRPIVGIPIERCIPFADETFWSFMAIAQQGWPFVRMGYLRTDMARNGMAEHILNHKEFTHLVMLDIDHEHKPDVVQRLVAHVEEHPDHLVVGGLAFRGGPPYEPLIFKEKEGELYTVCDWEPGETLSVDILGTAIIIIAREVFERLPGPPWFWYTYQFAKTGGWPTEDVAFSGLCRSHGIDLWLDTSITSDHLRIGHINEKVFRSYLEQFEGGVSNGGSQDTSEIAARA